MGRGLGSFSFKSPWFYTGWCWLGGKGGWAGRQGSPKTGLHQWHTLPGIFFPISIELLYMRKARRRRCWNQCPRGTSWSTLGTSPTTAGGKRWRSSTPGWAPCHTGDGPEDGDEELEEAPYHTTHSLFWWNQSNHHWTFYRHKIVIAGNHEITFDRASFDNIYAKKKVFGENYDPSDPKVRLWNVTLPFNNVTI